MPAIEANPSLIDLLLTRRSVSCALMTEDGPDAEALDLILRAGHRVPDHGKLGPWRFVIFEGAARGEFGQVLKDVFLTANPDAGEERASLEALRLMRAPTVICVISCATAHVKIPTWEQELSAGAACQNMLVAAMALGFGAQWLTEWFAFNDQVGNALGLVGDERVAGFIYLGGHPGPQDERVRPDLAERISRWSPR
ncbi:MAG: nitroreductase [Parvibaculum sp.]